MSLGGLCVARRLALGAAMAQPAHKFERAEVEQPVISGNTPRGVRPRCAAAPSCRRLALPGTGPLRNLVHGESPPGASAMAELLVMYFPTEARACTRTG